MGRCGCLRNIKLFGSVGNREQSSSANANGTHLVVMVRHGESEWNRKNIFTGWYDAELSDKGIQEAESAGRALKEAGWKFDVAYTSLLNRAQRTLTTILEEIGQGNLPVEKTWRLNERHYGNLTGMDKTKIANLYGAAQVQIWRRSFDVSPPPMGTENPFYSSIVDDPRYAGILTKEEIPKCESLKLTMERTLPFWNERVVPQIRAGKTVLIAAHGNSLRGIIKHLEQISDGDIVGLEIPTGIPFFYELGDDLKPIKPKVYLGGGDKKWSRTIAPDSNHVSAT